MATKKEMQGDAMASVDTAKAMVDKVLSIMGLILTEPSLTLSFSTNPIGFLMQILRHLGVTYEDLENWLTNFLIYIVPILEVGTKAFLLTHLKDVVSCSSDPRIPEKYRKKHKAQTDYNTSQENGLDIDIETIDYLDKLSVSPLSDYGKYMYFGLDGVTDSYKFARADDFDAFLWFVIHKGKFPNSSKVTVGNEGVMDKHTFKGKTNGSSLLGTLVVEPNGSPSSILLGNTFMYTPQSHVISMCIDAKYDDKNQIIKNTIVPISDDWSSVNWYSRRAYELGKNLGINWGVNNKTNVTKYKGKERDFSKEFGIVNLQYIDQASSDSPIIGTVNNKLRLTILPKPLVHVPDLTKGEKPWAFKKLLFNSKGELDPNGKYTLSSEGEGNITIEKGKVKVGKSPSEIIPLLYECYPGLTVYEFNYDFVMSLKLFDARVIASTLLDTLQNTTMGVDVGIVPMHQEATDTIKEIVKNIINSDDSVVDDCFHTFSNDRYDKLLSNTANKRLNKTDKFYSAKEILSTSLSGDVVNQEEVLHRAITQAKVSVTEGVDEKDKYAVGYNFAFDLVENLVQAIVQAVLSPKVLLILMVNQKIVGNSNFSFADITKMIRQIITSLVKEVRDLVVQELLKLVMEQLEPIIQMMSSALVLEQMNDYADIINDIIKNCPSIWFKFKNKLQDTTLDSVDYADIDVPTEEEKDKPNTNNC